ncbi:hypothetical protein BH24ACT22_BH24ACT22_06850 [soil metagenome]
MYCLLCQDSTLPFPVDFPAMRHAQNLNHHPLIVHIIDDSIIPDSDVVLITTCELPAALRPWFFFGGQ